MTDYNTDSRKLMLHKARANKRKELVGWVVAIAALFAMICLAGAEWWVL